MPTVSSCDGTSSRENVAWLRLLSARTYGKGSGNHRKAAWGRRDRERGGRNAGDDDAGRAAGGAEIVADHRLADPAPRDPAALGPGGLHRRGGDRLVPGLGGDPAARLHPFRLL